MKVAMLATVEAQLKSLEKTLTTKDNSINELNQRITVLTQTISNNQTDLNSFKNEYDQKITEIKSELEREQVDSERLMKSIQADHQVSVV